MCARVTEFKSSPEGKKWQSYTENLSDESTKLAIPRKKGERIDLPQLARKVEERRGNYSIMIRNSRSIWLKDAHLGLFSEDLSLPLFSSLSLSRLFVLNRFNTFSLSLFLLFPFFPLSSVCFSFYICVSVYLSLSVYLCLLTSISFIDLLCPFSLPFSCFLFSSSFSTLYVTSD